MAGASRAKNGTQTGTPRIPIKAGRDLEAGSGSELSKFEFGYLRLPMMRETQHPWL